MGKLNNNRRYLVFLLIILGLIYGAQINKIFFPPSNILIIKGENKSLDTVFPFSLKFEGEEKVITANYNPADSKIKRSYNLNGNDTGESQAQLKLLGFIPVKNYKINVISRPEVIPGGNAIGVRLNTRGVLVVAVTDIIDIQGERSSPAKQAGLRVGDSIIEIEGTKITDAQQVVSLLNTTQNKEIEITILRNKNEFKTKVKPVQSLQDNSYRLGIWVRDKTSGIGTLTYYDKDTKVFGALGHGIADIDTGGLLNVENGRIMNARVSDIELGKKGTPGEIRGAFYRTDDILGEIHINNEFGIFGSIAQEFVQQNAGTPMEIGFKEEVSEGRAYILTTLDNNRIEKFDIDIIKIQNQDKPEQKSMIVKVVDENLLSKTGGIVQGMSGSPIIQKDRLIGAITHVFINDPTKGYGIFIEWMLEKDKP